jgi:hypothetical protein
MLGTHDYQQKCFFAYLHTIKKTLLHQRLPEKGASPTGGQTAEKGN